MLPIEDTLAIHELLANYGNLIGAKAWDRLDEVFTEDVVFRSSTGRTYASRAELLAYLTSDEAMHPAGYHVTNIVLTGVSGDRASTLSKGLYVQVDGRTTTATYDDVVLRTPLGWRLAERTISVPTAP